SFGSGRSMYLLIWACVLLAMLATRNLLDSRPGRAIRSLRSSGDMAESFGVNMARYKTIIFIYAALMACLSGWLYAHMQRAVSPSPFGLNYSIEYLFMAVVGGAGSVWGAVLGSGLILTLKDQLQSLLPRLIDSNKNFELIFFGVLMVWVLQYARGGLWPLLQGWASALGITPRVPGRQLTNPAAALPQRARPTQQTEVLALDALRKEFGGLV